VVVFVTHSHVDHFDPIIHGWRETVSDIRYFFGWEVEEAPGCHSLPAPRACIRQEDLTIHTVNSHHSGVPEVAFLVQVDGLTLFHGGDYQGRMSRSPQHQVVEDMAYLRTLVDGVDLMFLGAWAGDPNRAVLRGLPPRVVFPMHDRKREERYLAFAAELADLGFTAPVTCPARRGDRFQYRNGEVTHLD
jgi:L-ascorbate metabolism protein UlaG (beta-lactamase superfamily)